MAVCAAIPSKARWGRTAIISLSMQATLLLHSYVHCNIWALSNILSTSWGCPRAGFLYFCPLLLLELGALTFHHVDARRNPVIQKPFKATLHRSDYAYYMVWVILAAMVRIVTPML